MGIYDRDYYRDEPKGFFLGGDRTVVVNLIIINVLLWVVDFFFPAGEHLKDYFGLRNETLYQPWMWWQFLTAGFIHEPERLPHVGFNMFMLYLFGRDVETIYGHREFLRLYLVMVVAASVVWCVLQNVLSPGQRAVMFGASGAVMGVLMLCCLHFPKRTILFMFVVPMPLWALAGLYVVMDLAGAVGPGDGVAHSAHLTGAAFAFLYWHFHWNIGRWIPRWASWDRLKRRIPKPGRPKLRVHRPEDERELSDQVDAILEKISREGEDSLTSRERKILEDASRRYQRRRKVD